jgi:hypothetical protein
MIQAKQAFGTDVGTFRIEPIGETHRIGKNGLGDAARTRARDRRDRVVSGPVISGMTWYVWSRASLLVSESSRRGASFGARFVVPGLVDLASAPSATFASVRTGTPQETKATTWMPS